MLMTKKDRALAARDNIFHYFWTEFDKTFNEFSKLTGDFTITPFGKSSTPKLNAYELDNKYYLDFYVPMATKDDVKVEIKDRTLKVEVKSTNDEKVSNDKYFYREVSRSASTRYVGLGDDIDLDSISAELKDGVLKISFDKISNNKEESKVVTVK